MPPLVGTNHQHRDVLGRMLLLELNPDSSDHIRLLGTLVGFQPDKVLEEIQVRDDTKVHLAQINEDGDV
jgi:hypothetical protein